MHDPWYTTEIDFFSMKLLCLLAAVCACSEQRSKVLELLNFCVSSLIFMHSIFIIILKDIGIQFMSCYVLARVFGSPTVILVRCFLRWLEPIYMRVGHVFE